jgi:hypothetical protein
MILSTIISFSESAVRILLFLGQGYLFSYFDRGGSSIKDNEPSKSIIRLIHNICIGFSGLYPTKTAPKRAIAAATKLIVS